MTDPGPGGPVDPPAAAAEPEPAPPTESGPSPAPRTGPEATPRTEPDSPPGTGTPPSQAPRTGPEPSAAESPEVAVNGPDPASAPRRQRVAILVVAGLGVAAFAVTLGLAIALGLAAEYAVRPAAAAQDWAGREPAYATRITCARCHSTQVVDQARSAHAATSCQGCHGPLDRHAGLAAVALAGPPPVVPSSSVCLTCHAAVEGRPAFLGQISPESHYVEGCLDCHAPHTGVAARPPVVSHPLDRLPACVTCHGPDGFRARDQRHPLTPTEDAVCLGCHAVDRGATGKPGSGTAGGESP